MNKIILSLTLVIFLSACSQRQSEIKPAEVSPYFNALDKTKDIVEQNKIKNAAEEEVLSDVTQKAVEGVKISQNYLKVLKVVDGDTIDVEIGGKASRVRMIGVNTPESVDPRRPVECFGKEASAKAAQLLGGKLIALESDPSQDDKDKYGRLLRYVRTDEGLFYNLEIIRLGYAHEHTYRLPYKYRKDFKAAQKSAAEKKLGLWADGACGLKNVTKPVSPKADTGANPACKIKGNINGKKQKIYHLPACPDYDKTSIDQTSGEHWFCDEAEAIRSGWRKAGNCK